MFYEPNQSPYDFRFQLLGIPVRVSPWFWFWSVVLGMSAGGARELILWVLAVFLSILIHEMGHAVVIRHYGFRPRIVLYSFGGLTIHDRTHRLMWYENIFISFAGPLAGFLFLGSVLGIFYLMGYRTIGNLVLCMFSSVEIPLVMSRNLTFFLLFLTQVNLFWGILNLLPIFPLDGGQISREFCQRLSPAYGFRWMLQVSTGTAAAMALFFLFAMNSMFAAMMFGMIAFSNYQMLKMASY
ncbi:MAG: site-2 protease family protein [Planctomycetia bacterium]|nr:site-2 protease family protein [Planctomycetia bacterium]